MAALRPRTRLLWFRISPVSPPQWVTILRLRLYLRFECRLRPSQAFSKMVIPLRGSLFATTHTLSFFDLKYPFGNEKKSEVACLLVH